MAASEHFSYPVPYGSHPQLDPLWSSSALEIRLTGGQWERHEKLAAVADELLVQRYLRVCWHNHGDNCTRCEKCLRTEIVLAQLGRLESFSGFGTEQTLAARIDGIFRAEWMLYFEMTLGLGLSEDLSRAIRRLGLRSARPDWRRLVISWLLRIWEKARGYGPAD